MQCNNIKCPHYRKPTKRDWVDKMLGVTFKVGGCPFAWCKAKSRKGQKWKKVI